MLRIFQSKIAFAVIVCACIYAGTAVAARAEVVVIGSPSLGVSSLSDEQVKDLYLGKISTLPDGSNVEVVDLPSGDAVRDEFYEKVLGKDASQIKSYWAKRIFTGKGTPPDTKNGEGAVKNWVKEAPGRIGYISAGTVDSSVKVLMRKP